MNEKVIDPAALPYHEKIEQMGHHTTALLQLHLKDPEYYDAVKILEKLFVQFENMELEEETE